MFLITEGCSGNVPEHARVLHNFQAVLLKREAAGP